MTIGEVANAAGVNIQTLRYYERRGLLASPPRTDGGHRLYEDEAVRLVRFVKRAQNLGFTLSEIEALLQLRTATMPRRAAQTLARERIADIDAKVAQLQGIRATLAELVATCERGGRGPCPILEAMDGADGPAARAPKRRSVR